jgi:hypothetical protein
MKASHRGHGWNRVGLVQLGILILAGITLITVPAQARGVVGTGTPGSCTYDALIAAMVGGDLVTFNCGAVPVIIILTTPGGVIPAPNTTIDGGGLITLSGQNAERLFFVSSGASLTLRNIVLTNGFSGGDGGAIYNNLGGVLILEKTTIRNSTASLSGGAIVSYGPLTITDSLLEGNRALNGGALFPRFPAAQTTIVNSVLRDNHTTDTTNGWGGAILAWDGAPVTIERSDIFSNSGRLGGGIYIFPNSSVTLNGGTLHDNTAFNLGGGLFNDTGTATLTNVTLSGNQSTGNDGGGGGVYNTGTATLTNVTLSGNQSTGNASVGGGVYNTGTATLTNVTLNGNSAIAGGGVFNTNGTATLTNVTLSGNSAIQGGGVFNNNGTATLTNVTLSGNSAVLEGGGIEHFGTSGRILALKNSIVANSPAGGNCYQISISQSSITSNGFNLSGDTSCAQFLNLASDRNNQNPLLGLLANNGGPTLTHLPQADSPARDNGSGCPATDQRGAARPVGPACDIGAVEYGAKLPWLYLPMIIRN